MHQGSAEETVKSAGALLAALASEGACDQNPEELEAIKAVGALCSQGPMIQGLAIDEKIHVSIAKLISHKGGPWPGTAASLRALVNMGCNNESAWRRLMEDLCMETDHIVALARSGRESGEDEALLVLLNGLLSGGSGMIKAFSNSPAALEMLEEVLKAGSSDYGGLGYLITNVIKRLVDGGGGAVILSLLGRPGSMMEALKVLDASGAELECMEEVCRAMHVLVEENLPVITKVPLEPAACRDLAAVRSALRILSRELLKAREDERARISRMSTPRDLHELLLASNQISSRQKAGGNALAEILFNFKSDIVLCIAALSDGCTEAKAAFAALETMPIIMGLCAMDAANPVLREYCILAIRILTENSLENSRFIEGLTPILIDPASQTLVRESSGGLLEATLDQDGRVKVAPQSLYVDYGAADNST